MPTTLFVGLLALACTPAAGVLLGEPKEPKLELPAEEMLWPEEYEEGKGPGRVATRALSEFVQAYKPAHAALMGPGCYHNDAPVGNHYFNVTVPTIFPFVVDEKKENRVPAAALVVASGRGRYIEFDRAVELAKWLNKQGISAFVLKHRTSQETYVDGDKIQEYDVQRAMRWIRQRSDDYDIDLSKVGIVAAGTGADLALRAAGQLEAGYPQYDETDNGRFNAEFMVLVSPILYQRTEEAVQRAGATFFTLAQDDACEPGVEWGEEAPMSWNGVFNFYSKTLGARLEAPPSEFHGYKAGGHGFYTCKKFKDMAGEEVCDWTKKAEVFIKRTLNAKWLYLLANNQYKKSSRQRARVAEIEGVKCPPKDAGVEPTRAYARSHQAENINCDQACWTQCM